MNSLRAAVPALAAYLSIRLLGLLAVLGWAARSGTDPFDPLSRRWDAVWYASIAEHGYQRVVRTPDGAHADYAFFPLYPALMRAVAALTPLDAPAAGLAVSWLAALVAAWGVYAVGERLFDRRVGLLLVVLWAAFPVAIVGSMAYTEALFTALAAWALYAVLSGRWLWAGALCVLAGLTRPTAVALIAAVGLAALVACVRERRPLWTPLAGAVLAPLGWLAYVAWVGFRTGSVTGYFEVQDAWGNVATGSNAAVGFVWEQLVGAAPLRGLGLGLAMLVVVAVFALCVRQRQPLPLLVYAGTLVGLALLATGHFNAVPRVLLPAFPLLLPVAAGLARLRPPLVVVISVVLAAGSAYYGVHMLVVAPAPP